ncbi:fibronectin type III domain-containing protein [Dactylosporangium sp. NPDC006015]|uniref:fibronectin type III domain-containing protein n=1 Tax=Dactylosporangium sp. NPDC006015 TaxID=3154576 RepID=UPI0033B27EB2
MITGLANGRAHVFTVVAYAAPGSGPADSPPSMPSTAVYPGVAPGAPLAVTAVARDSGLMVSWRPPADAGSGISHYSATSTSNGRCATLDGTADRCTMFVPIGADYQVSVVAHGEYGGESPPVPAAVWTTPTFPEMPAQATDLIASGSLNSSRGGARDVMEPGDPITLDGGGFAPNSSVRFAAYTSGGAADDVRVDLLGTPTATTDGTAVVATAGMRLAFLARGVAPDGTVRSLLLWADLPGSAPDIGPLPGPEPEPVTAPVTGGPGTGPAAAPPVRRARTGGLATTGPPVGSSLVTGLLLLFAGVALRRVARYDKDPAFQRSVVGQLRRVKGNRARPTGVSTRCLRHDSARKAAGSGFRSWSERRGSSSR